MGCYTILTSNADHWNPTYRQAGRKAGLQIQHCNYNMQVNCSFLPYVVRWLPSALIICCWGIHLQTITDSDKILSPSLLLRYIHILFLMLPYMFLSSPLGSKSSFAEYEGRIKILKNMLLSCPFKTPSISKDSAYKTLFPAILHSLPDTCEGHRQFKRKIKRQPMNLATSQQLSE